MPGGGSNRPGRAGRSLRITTRCGGRRSLRRNARRARCGTLSRVALGLLAGTLVACEPALPPLEIGERLVYANPGWSDRDRQIFYYTPQGTELYGLRYSWFLALELPASDRKLADPALLSRLGFVIDPLADPVANPGGLPVGFTHHADPHGGGALLDISCAACHTGELHHQGTALRIDGGQAMHALASPKLGQFPSLLLGSLLYTYVDPFAFDAFAQRVLGVEYPHEKRRLREDLARVTQRFIREAWNGRDLYPTADGYGRTDALGHIANAVFGDGLDPRNYRLADAPVSYPHVWDIWKFDWVQWNGSVAQAMGRNVGEALGVKAPLKMVDEFGATLPGDARFASGVLVRELHCLESTLWQLEPPVWDEEVLGRIDLERAREGRRLFDVDCRRCHGPHRYDPARQPTPGKPFEWRVTLVPTSEIGTDPLAAANFVENVYDASTVDPAQPQLARVRSGEVLNTVTAGVVARKYAELGLDEEDRWWFDGFGRPTEVQIVRSYKARPLHGVWATPPFLHNGSVPTLYQLLSPEEERAASFWVGTREFDPKHVGYRSEPIENGFLFDTSLPGNANTGHQFRDDGGVGVIGPALSPDERLALIEFLKVLGNPDPRFESLWREPGSRERWADPRLPDEIPPAHLPAYFTRKAQFAGLPPPDCGARDGIPAAQGPASLSERQLPRTLSRSVRKARETAARSALEARSQP